MSWRNKAAEKATKALLVQLGVDFPRTHDVLRLVKLLPVEVLVERVRGRQDLHHSAKAGAVVGRAARARGGGRASGGAGRRPLTGDRCSRRRRGDAADRSGGGAALR
ncbi:MAG: HEPN domain-containing protein [Egibacteraceae bacterium]